MPDQETETLFFHEARQCLERLLPHIGNPSAFDSFSVTSSLQLPHQLQNQIYNSLSMVNTVEKFGNVASFLKRNLEGGTQELNSVLEFLSIGVVQLVYFQEFIINEKSPTLQHYLNSEKCLKKEGATQTWNLLFRGLSTLNSEILRDILQNFSLSIQELIDIKRETFFEKHFLIFRALQKLSRNDELEYGSSKDRKQNSKEKLQKIEKNHQETINRYESYSPDSTSNLAFSKRKFGSDRSGDSSNRSSITNQSISSNRSSTVVTISKNQIKDLSFPHIQQSKLGINPVKMSINEQAFTAYDPLVDETQDDDEFVEMGIQDSIINFPSKGPSIRSSFVMEEDEFNPMISPEVSPASRRDILTTDTPPIPSYLAKKQNNLDSTLDSNDSFHASDEQYSFKQSQNGKMDKYTKKFENESSSNNEEENANYINDTDENQYNNQYDENNNSEDNNSNDLYEKSFDESLKSNKNKFEVYGDYDETNLTFTDDHKVKSNSRDNRNNNSIQMKSVHFPNNNFDKKNIENERKDISYHPEFYEEDSYSDENTGNDFKENNKEIDRKNYLSSEMRGSIHSQSQSKSSSFEESYSPEAYSSENIEQKSSTPQHKIQFTAPRSRPTTSTNAQKDFFGDSKNVNLDHRTRSMAHFDKLNLEARDVVLLPSKIDDLSESEQLKQIKKENQMLRMLLLDQQMQSQKEKNDWDSKLKSELMKARAEGMKQTIKTRPSTVQGPRMATINIEEDSSDLSALKPNRRPSTTPGGVRGNNVQINTVDLQPTLKTKSSNILNSARVKNASNKTMIENAIQRACFPGKINELSRTQALEAVGNTQCDRFIISLTRENSTTCRGIYAIENTGEEAVAIKIFGKGPKRFTSKSVRSFFRYNSTTKSFIPQESKSFTVSDLRIDAILLLSIAK